MCRIFPQPVQHQVGWMSEKQKREQLGWTNPQVCETLGQGLVMTHSGQRRHSHPELLQIIFIGTQSYSFVHALFWAAFVLQQQRWVLVMETVRPVKPKIFTIWPFIEKVCWPLLWDSNENWPVWITSCPMIPGQFVSPRSLVTGFWQCWHLRVTRLFETGSHLPESSSSRQRRLGILDRCSTKFFKNRNLLFLWD